MCPQKESLLKRCEFRQERDGGTKTSAKKCSGLCCSAMAVPFSLQVELFVVYHLLEWEVISIAI